MDGEELALTHKEANTRSEQKQEQELGLDDPMLDAYIPCLPYYCAAVQA